MFFLKTNFKKKNKKIKQKKLNKKINFYIKKISEIIEQKKVINFLHSGHLGDLINSLPVIKEKHSVLSTKKYPHRMQLIVSSAIGGLCHGVNLNSMTALREVMDL